MSENIYVPPEEFLEGREHQLPPDTRTLTADMSRAELHADNAARTPLGEPTLDFNVRSIFDSRPVNTIDFNIPAFFEGPTTTSFTEAVMSFVVPDGSVCVLRKTHTWSEIGNGSIGTATERSDIKASFMLDGVTVQYNQDIPVGPEQDDLLRTFIIADERQVVAVKLVSGVGVPWPQFTVVWAHFYGNFIAKTGRPKQFEIANPAGSGVPSRVAPPPPPRMPSRNPIMPPDMPPAPVAVAAPRRVLAPPVVPKRRVTFSRG